MNKDFKPKTDYLNKSGVYKMKCDILGRQVEIIIKTNQIQINLCKSLNPERPHNRSAFHNRRKILPVEKLY